VTTSIFGSSYQNWIDNLYSSIGPVAVVLLIMSIALIGGFGISRICKSFKIPYVTGYIILGIILGPSLLGVIPSYMLSGYVGEGTISGELAHVGFAGLSFIGDICMGFIAYSIGKFFKWSNIKETGKKAAIVGFLTCFCVGILVGFGSYLVYGIIFKVEGLGLVPAFILGAVAMAVSPTALASIIRQYRARGQYVKNLFQVLIIFDIAAILVFTVIIGVTSGLVDTSQTFNIGLLFKSAGLPLLHTLIVCGIAILLGWLLSLLNNYRRTNDSRIILVIAFNVIIVLLSSLTKITPLLPCMAFGMFYYNFAKSESLFLQLEEFLPPILCLFFVVSGAKLDFSSFNNISVLIIAILFAVLRTGGHFVGVNLFGRLANYDNNTVKYLPLSLMCMTSVAVGLMNLATNVLANSTAMPMINYCYAIVLTSAVILEIIGPTVGKVALIKTNSVDPATLIPSKDPKKAKSSEMTNM
jgi:Kef-type K+ transport system membrane component KefB